MEDSAAYDLLQRAKCRLIMKEPFYGTIAMMMDFREETRTPTMGVRIVSNGIVACGYNPAFLKTLSLEQIYAIIMHECEHIIRLHPLREEAREHDAFNVATDFTINGKKSNPRCAYREEGRKPIPPIDDACFIPEDWPDNENAEKYYTMLPKCKKCGSVLPWDQKTGKAAKCDKNGQQPGSGKGKDKQGQGQQGQGQGQGQQSGQGQGQQGQGQGQGQQPGQGQGQGQQPGQGGCGCEHVCPECGNHKGSGDYRNGNAGGKLVDDHGMWDDSDVSQDEARQIVRQIVEQAMSNSQGNVPGHLKEILEELNKPIVRWREVIRRFLGRHCGGYRRTHARKDRRHDVFGAKGISHHAVATCGVIVDTSGSIGTEELKQFFAEIEAIGSKTKTWVMQWDAEFKGMHPRYRRGDWKKIEIKGRCGTRMDLAQEYIVKEKVPADVIVMLTDGETPWRKDAMPMPMFVCLTAENDVPAYAEKVKMPVLK